MADLDAPMSLGLAALSEMRERDRAAGIDPSTPSPVIGGPAPPPAPPLYVPPADWAEEDLAARRRALELERQRAITAPVVAEVPQVPEDEEPRPARPARWKREQMSPDRGRAA